jgi:hypothetical protein
MDEITAAVERAELYFIAHPRRPSAIRRPQLLKRSGSWVAMLGGNIQEGMAGFGPTVEAALRAFDAQYVASLQAPDSHTNPGLRAPINGPVRLAA